MAVVVTCDVAACGAEIQRLDVGQPTLQGKADVYCARCTAYIALVDQEMAKIYNARGFALVSELEELRRAKIKEALPAQKGGTGPVPQWTIEAAE